MSHIIDQAEAAKMLYVHPATLAKYLDTGPNGEPPILEVVKIGRIRKTTLESVMRYREASLPWSLAERRRIMAEMSDDG
jgi:hypothetical protein